MVNGEAPVPIPSPESYLTPQKWGSALSSRDIPGFADLTESMQFKLLAWGAACPVPNRVWSEYQVMGGEALEWLMNRYETTNAVTRHVIWSTAAARNPELYLQLTTPIPRFTDEPVGDFEPESAPFNHATYISPMSTLTGYAGARELILTARIDQVDTILQSPKIMKMVYGAIDKAKTPVELLAYLALGAFEAGANPGAIIEHAFELAKLYEEGYERAYRKQYGVFMTIAPILIRAWNIMHHLTPFPPRRSELHYQKHYKYDPNNPDESLSYLYGSPLNPQSFSLTTG